MDKSNRIIVHIRKIIRAIDSHSNYLLQKYGMTGPQLMACSIIVSHNNLSVTELSKAMHLSKATVVSILDRLVIKGLIRRQKAIEDRRKVLVYPTDLLLSMTPPQLLQQGFIERFNQLKDWEQSIILASFERVSEMMQTDTLPTEPLLVR